MGGTNTKMTSIVIDAVGAEYLLTECLELNGEMIKQSDYMQQTAVLRTAYILRKVLPIPA